MSEIENNTTEPQEVPSSVSCADTFDYDSVTEPHWLFERNIVLNSLLLLTLVSHDGADLSSSLCRLKRVYDGVELTVNSGDIAIRAVVPLLNPDNILEAEYLINFRTFSTLVKNAGVKFIIKENSGTPVMIFLGGDAELETFTLENADVVYGPVAFSEQDGFSSYSSADFLAVLQRCSLSMALAQTPESRKVRIESDGKVYSNFTSSVFMTVGSPVTNISLRAIDVQVLMRLMLDGSDFQFKEVQDGYLFVSQASKVLLRKWRTDESIGVSSYLLPSTSAKFPISPSYTVKIVGMMREILGSMGILRWASNNGKLIITAKTRQGKILSFPITTLPPDASFNILCPVEVLWAMLSLYRNDGVMDVLFEGNRMQFVSDKITVLFGSNI